MWVALPPSLSEHWTTHSVPILLNVYSTLDFLNNTYRTNPRDGPLVWAAHLFSRTYVTNIRYPTSIHKDSEAETQRELGTYLGRTLSSVGAALKSSQGAFRDDVLATVWILSNYEVGPSVMTRRWPNVWRLTLPIAACGLAGPDGTHEPLASACEGPVQYPQSQRKRAALHRCRPHGLLAMLQHGGRLSCPGMSHRRVLTRGSKSKRLSATRNAPPNPTNGSAS